ncbi:MAG: hypothetical protein R1F52_00880 [Candidatus Nitrosoabyssus spongiisocia]|nr:MAG: hypothetical protein R1F52_00880 [Nitrosopumilaceae archaeon AB1(1)]
MTIPFRNIVFEYIKNKESLTNVELQKLLVKTNPEITSDRLEKLLLELEILGTISVTWLAKDTRRIEVIVEKEEIDKIEEQNKETQIKEYEVSFPGAVD